MFSQKKTIFKALLDGSWVSRIDPRFRWIMNFTARISNLRSDGCYIEEKEEYSNSAKTKRKTFYRLMSFPQELLNGEDKTKYRKFPGSDILCLKKF